VRIWDVDKGVTLQAFEGKTGVTTLSYSNDGSIMTNCGRVCATALNNNALLSPKSLPQLLQPIASLPPIGYQIEHMEKGVRWLLDIIDREGSSDVSQRLAFPNPLSMMYIT